MGGGGFTMEPTNPLLDDYLLTLTSSPEPRILFLPTASGDTTTQINAFHARFGGRACVPTHLSLFRLGDLRALARGDRSRAGRRVCRRRLDAQPARDLARARARPIAHARLAKGVVLAGLSAGAMCWFEGGITCSSGAPEPIAGLGLLRGSLTVHADGEPERLPAWLTSVR